MRPTAASRMDESRVPYSCTRPSQPWMAGLSPALGRGVLREQHSGPTRPTDAAPEPAPDRCWATGSAGCPVPTSRNHRPERTSQRAAGCSRQPGSLGCRRAGLHEWRRPWRRGTAATSITSSRPAEAWTLTRWMRMARERSTTMARGPLCQFGPPVATNPCGLQAGRTRT